MVTDTISDVLTRIRNANMVRHRVVQIPATRISKAIVEILKIEGFIKNFENYNGYLLVSLKYSGKLRKPVICSTSSYSISGKINCSFKPKV